jgi:DnaJ-class molecular chaperone
VRAPADEPDFYAVLGVAADASASEISGAFRRKALVNHPDHGGDARAFRDLYRARKTLLDPRDRAAYDRRRRSAKSTAAPPQPDVSPEPDMPQTADPFQWTTGAGPSSDGWTTYTDPFPAFEPGYSWRRSDRFAWWKPAPRAETRRRRRRSG